MKALLAVPWKTMGLMVNELLAVVSVKGPAIDALFTPTASI
jgi:hypothetical protein